MNSKALLFLGVLALAGCGQSGQSSTLTASMPLNSGGGPFLSQDQAIALASWALKDPSNTAGNPSRAARAIAAEDWLSGQTMLYGTYDGYAPYGTLAWSQFRDEARTAIGVPLTAPSQEVVDRLTAASIALKDGKTDAAKAQLSAPIFTLGPDRTLAVLTNLPKLTGRDWAFAELNRNTDRTMGGNTGLFH
jgi:hypothetical protein